MTGEELWRECADGHVRKPIVAGRARMFPTIKRSGIKKNHTVIMPYYFDIST